VAGRVNHFGFETAPDEFVAVAEEAIDFGHFGRGDAQPLGLGGESQVEFEIVGMKDDRGAGGATEPGEAAYVVDVGVGAYDGADFQVVAREDFLDAVDFVAGIDYEGFMSIRIAYYRAVALEHAHGEDFVDQALGHRVEYSIGVAMG
jgi:hypothetical protein